MYKFSFVRRDSSFDENIPFVVEYHLFTAFVLSSTVLCKQLFFSLMFYTRRRARTGSVLLAGKWYTLHTFWKFLMTFFLIVSKVLTWHWCKGPNANGQKGAHRDPPVIPVGQYKPARRYLKYSTYSKEYPFTIEWFLEITCLNITVYFVLNSLINEPILPLALSALFVLSFTSFGEVSCHWTKIINVECLIR